MIFGYARVSTQQQSLDEQIEKLRRAGAEKIYYEKFTGRTNKRPEFEKLKKRLLPGDELIVTKLDRLGRKTSETTKFLDECFKRDITVNVLNMGRLDDSASGKLMRNVVLAFAEFERDMIITRTQEGKKYAKLHNKNYREGRPKRVITPKYRMIYEYKTSGHSYTETAKAFEVSKSTIQRIVKQVESEKEAIE